MLILFFLLTQNHLHAAKIPSSGKMKIPQKTSLTVFKSHAITKAMLQFWRNGEQEMSVGHNVVGSQILSVIERVERLTEEIKELNADKTEVFSEAKGNGLDVAIIKEIVKMRRLGPTAQSEKDEILGLYLNAISAAQAQGVPQ